MRDEQGWIRLTPKKKFISQMFNRKDSKMLVFRHGHIAITDYKLGDNQAFEKALSVFDEMRWKYELKTGLYIPELKEMRIPRGYDLSVLRSFFPNYPVMVDNDAYPADKIDNVLTVPPRDDFQKVCLSFLCSMGNFKKNLIYTTLMVDAPTGKGKTYVGVAASCFLRARTIIISPISKLVGQWKESFTTFTDIKEDEIMLVQGSKNCKEIMEGKHKNIKVFIFTVDTIISFATRYGYGSAIEMFYQTNAYLKIVDEVHRDLKAVSIIEGLTNCRMNYYMSATPKRTQRKEKWIFKTLYRNVPRFGKDFFGKEDNHINVIIKRYRFTLTIAQQKRVVQARTKWLNSSSYEKELIHSPPEQLKDLTDSILIMLKWSKRLIVGNNKILFLTKTVDGTAFVQELAEQVYPGETSRYYRTGMSNAERQKALEARVICATSASMGTGADIKDENGKPLVQHVHNLVTYSNEIDAEQLPGRAREMNGVEVVYIEYVNVAYSKTMNQFASRERTLRTISKNGKLQYVD